MTYLHRKKNDQHSCTYVHRLVNTYTLRELLAFENMYTSHMANPGPARDNLRPKATILNLSLIHI